MKLSRIALLCAGLLASSGVVLAAPSKLVVLQAEDLAFSRQQIQQQNPQYLPAYQALIRQADKVLHNKAVSVMDKSLVAVSGDKHDYYSFPPYWWPDPNKPDGMPYIRKDGVSNPAANNDETDKKRMNIFGHNVSTLALAYYFTGNRAYAEKAQQLLQVWFIDPATRMNPNLRYAQVIPGKNKGIGHSVIDARILVDVIDAIELLRPADVINDKQYQQLQAWYRDMGQWLVTEQPGINEDKSANNHATFFDLEAAAFARFSGEDQLAQQRLKITQGRIGTQLETDGKQPFELARTRSWHYSNFNLQAFSGLALIGQHAGVDIAHFDVDGRKLQNSYRYIAKFIDSDKSWPDKDIGGVTGDVALENMLVAARLYKEPIFAQKAAYLMATYPNDITLLIHPLRR